MALVKLKAGSWANPRVMAKGLSFRVSLHGGEWQGHTLSGQSDTFHHRGEAPANNFLSEAALSGPCCSLAGAQHEHSVQEGGGSCKDGMRPGVLKVLQR